MAVKEEPLSEEDLRALQKDRQKKDNHNMSESNHNMYFIVVPPVYSFLPLCSVVKILLPEISIFPLKIGNAQLKVLILSSLKLQT